MTDAHWMFLVDQQCGRLLQGRLVSGRPHLEQVARLANDAPEIERDPPSTLAGKGAHAFAAPHHVEEEERRRWAHKAANWLDLHIVNRGIGRVAVLAPAPLLGCLRRAWPAHLVHRIDDDEGEFTGMTTSELEGQPRIARLLAASTSA